MDFMDDLLGHKGKKEKQGSKLVVKHDDWDFDDWSRILSEMKALSNADDNLTNFTPTGHEAMTDAFFSLYKAIPKLEAQNKIRPSYLVNHMVMDEAMKLKEYDELRMYSQLDIVAAGMACTAIEPDLEILFDRLEDEVQKAQQLEETLQGIEGLEGDSKSVDDLIAEAMGDGDTEKEQELKDQQALIAAHMEVLRQQAEQQTQELAEALQGKSSMIGQALKETIDKAKEQAENVDSLSTSWGLDPGTIKKMSAEKRIELAKRVNNEKFRNIAKIIGPMTRLAMAEQSRKLDFANDEIFDLELGDDLWRVISEELLFMVDDDLDLVFYQNYFQQNLMQFKMRGTEKIAKGGIYFCEDGSSSMHGPKEVWAKAVGLALLQIALRQKRDFFSVHFCGPGVYKTHDFADPKKVVAFSNPDPKKQGYTEEFNQLDGMLDYAETFFSGGTCFMTPLGIAIDKLRKEFNETGKVKGDIVFCTDGQSDVSEAFKEELAKAKEELGFRIFGIILDGSVLSEPLNTICDHRVFTVKDLMEGKSLADGEDIRKIFRDV